MSSHPPQHHEGRHPTFKQYVAIAIILFVITAVEFAIILPDGLKGSSIVVAPLIILSALKFAIVIMFYMHLKFDSRMFTVVFIAGLVLAFSVGVAVLGLYGSYEPEPRDYAEANAVPFVHGAEAGGHEEQPSEPHATEEPSGGAEQPTEEPATGGSDLAAQGRTVFTSSGGCMACHTIEGVSTGAVGPDLTHIGTEAADRKPGTSARDYIEESIREPEAFVATGVPNAIPGIMTSALTANLSDADIEALVEFLLAQK